MTAKSNQLPPSTSKEIKEPFHPPSLLRFNQEHDLKFTRKPLGIGALIHCFPGQTFDKKRNTPLYPPPPALILPRATVNAHFVLNLLFAWGRGCPPQGCGSSTCSCACSRWDESGGQGGVGSCNPEPRTQRVEVPAPVNSGHHYVPGQAV